MDNNNNDSIHSALQSDSARHKAKMASTQVIDATNQQMLAATTAAQAVSSEMMRYAGQRLHAHAEHLQTLSSCDTPQRFMEQQMAFMRASAQQFSQGFTSLFQVAKGAAAKQTS